MFDDERLEESRGVLEYYIRPIAARQTVSLIREPRSFRDFVRERRNAVLSALDAIEGMRATEGRFPLPDSKREPDPRTLTSKPARSSDDGDAISPRRANVR